MWCDMVVEFSVTSPDRSYNRLIDNLSPLVLYVLLWFKCDIWVKAPPTLVDVSTGITLYTSWMLCTINLNCYLHPVWFPKVLAIFFSRIYVPEELCGQSIDISKKQGQATSITSRIAAISRYGLIGEVEPKTRNPQLLVFLRFDLNKNQSCCILAFIIVVLKPAKL